MRFVTMYRSKLARITGFGASGVDISGPVIAGDPKGKARQSNNAGITE